MWWWFTVVSVVVGLQDPNQVKHQFKADGRVRQLNSSDFESVTGIGNRSQTKPWFIMFYASWCDHCYPLVPWWDRVAEKFYQQINFAAIDCHDSEDLRDRFDIPLFPSFMYFSLDGEMHPFIGYRTMDNITEWIETEKWRSLEAQFTEIPAHPTTKSIIKRYIRRIFSPIPIAIFFLSFAGAIIGFCIWDDRQTKKKLEEARRIKQELIRRKQEKELSEFKTKIQ